MGAHSISSHDNIPCNSFEFGPGQIPIIANHLRLARLEQLGVSAGLQALSSGECIDEVFRFQCLGPPFYACNEAGVPDGPTMVPLWDRDDRVIGIQATPEGLAFVEYNVEEPQDLSVLARTEQGFWAHQFDSLYEADESVDDLRHAADMVEFRFLDLCLSRREAVEPELETFEAHDRWLAALIAEIDQAAPGVSSSF